MKSPGVNALVAHHLRLLPSFVTAVMILLNAMFVHYLVDLRRRHCPCATSDWRNPTLIGLMLALLVANMAQLAGIVHHGPWLHNALALVNFATIVVGVTYLQKLYEVDCQTCSDSPMRFLFRVFIDWNFFRYGMVILLVVFELLLILEFAVANWVHRR